MLLIPSFHHVIQVREHLEIFATLKGVKEDFLERTVVDMVNEVRI